jgi:hypothetical protein
MLSVASDVPREVLHTVDGLTFAIRIPGHIVAASRNKIIDTETGEGDLDDRLVLR